MAVPPQALPFWIMLGELATRYEFARHCKIGDIFCGTVITVPYKDIENACRTDANACIDLHSDL